MRDRRLGHVASELTRDRILVCRHDHLCGPSGACGSSKGVRHSASSTRVKTFQGFVEPRERNRGRGVEHEQVRDESCPDLFAAAKAVPTQASISDDTYDRPVGLQLKAVLSEEHLPAPPDTASDRFDVM